MAITNNFKKFGIGNINIISGEPTLSTKLSNNSYFPTSSSGDYTYLYTSDLNILFQNAGLPGYSLLEWIKDTLGNSGSGSYDISTTPDTFISKFETDLTNSIKLVKVNASTAADAATKATNDGNDNSIVDTYATKTALATTNGNITTLQGYFTSGKANSAVTAEACSGNSASATNVTTNINGKAISSIFEANGIYAKHATLADTASNASDMSISLSGGEFDRESGGSGPYGEASTSSSGIKGGTNIYASCDTGDTNAYLYVENDGENSVEYNIKVNSSGDLLTTGNISSQFTSMYLHRLHIEGRTSGSTNYNNIGVDLDIYCNDVTNFSTGSSRTFEQALQAIINSLQSGYDSSPTSIVASGYMLQRQTSYYQYAVIGATIDSGETGTDQLKIRLLNTKSDSITAMVSELAINTFSTSASVKDSVIKIGSIKS